MREADIQTQIVKWCRTNGIWIVKYPGGIFGTTGTPDLILCLKGRFVALEVKTTKGRLTKMQELTKTRLISAGAVCETVRSLEDAVRVVEGVLHESR